MRTKEASHHLRFSFLKSIKRLSHNSVVNLIKQLGRFSGFFSSKILVRPKQVSCSIELLTPRLLRDWHMTEQHLCNNLVQIKMLGGTRVASKSVYKHSMIFHIEQVLGVTFFFFFFFKPQPQVLQRLQRLRF